MVSNKNIFVRIYFKDICIKIYKSTRICQFVDLTSHFAVSPVSIEATSKDLVGVFGNSLALSCRAYGYPLPG